MFLFIKGSKNGTNEFIVGMEDKFISSAINIFPFIADSVKGPLCSSIFPSFIFKVP